MTLRSSAVASLVHWGQSSQEATRIDSGGLEGDGEDTLEKDGGDQGHPPQATCET